MPIKVSLWIDHHAHKQDGVSALISDHHQKRMIGDESESLPERLFLYAN